MTCTPCSSGCSARATCVRPRPARVTTSGPTSSRTPGRRGSPPSCRRRTRRPPSPTWPARSTDAGGPMRRASSSPGPRLGAGRRRHGIHHDQRRRHPRGHPGQRLRRAPADRAGRDGRRVPRPNRWPRSRPRSCRARSPEPELIHLAAVEPEPPADVVASRTSTSMILDADADTAPIEAVTVELPVRRAFAAEALRCRSWRRDSRRSTRRYPTAIEPDVERSRPPSTHVEPVDTVPVEPGCGRRGGARAIDAAAPPSC